MSLKYNTSFTFGYRDVHDYGVFEFKFMYSLIKCESFVNVGSLSKLVGKNTIINRRQNLRLYLK